jgi:hypothetical protein
MPDLGAGDRAQRAPIRSPTREIFVPLPKIESATGDAATPARNSSESPGKKKPMSRPVSAKRIAQTPIRPKVCSRSFGSIGLRASCSVSAWVSTPSTLPKSAEPYLHRSCRTCTEVSG